MNKTLVFCMAHKRLLLLLVLLFAFPLTSCSPGHVGSNEISFVRDGHLWTIDPDGANAFTVVSSNSPVIGYEWSPDHRILAFRTIDSNFAKTDLGQHLISNPVTGLTKDTPSVLNTIGIDGGTPIPIIESGPDIQYSNSWWNPTGNRLLYREETTTKVQNPGTQSWWASQNDQPLAIARKLLPYTYSIPSSSQNGMAIGNSSQGVFTTTLDGSQVQFIQQAVLPGHPLPASLERIVWQPGHQHPDILYAIATKNIGKVPSYLCKGGGGGVGGGDPCGRPQALMTVQLIIRDRSGQSRTIASCTCTQFAWSPDGNYVLYTTGTNYTILNTIDFTSLNVLSEEGSVPYWSPDSQFMLLDGLQTLRLVNIARQQQQLLLRNVAPEFNTASPTMPDAQALLQPISNSIWATDSRQFLFLTKNRLSWQGKNLDAGKGLYTVSIDDNGQVQGLPAVVDTGHDSQAGWTYEDPNTSFLF